MNFHGGNIYNYDRELLDFSSNINPLGVPESLKIELNSRLDVLTRYPDIEYRALRKSLCDYLSLEDQNCIIPGNGAIELIYKFFACMAAEDIKKAIITVPTFSEYSRAARSCGLEAYEVDGFTEGFEAYDVEKLISAIEPDSVIVICNPNNPTGTMMAEAEIIRLAKELASKNGYLLLDETFIEFTADYPKSSMVPLLEEHRNILVVRAITKYFGMPGIRLGYTVGCDDRLISGIKSKLEPWNINAIAVLAAETILKDKAYIKASKAWVKTERRYMTEKLQDMDKLEVSKAGANFFLIKLLDKKINAYSLRDMLLEHNILIRTPDGFSGLDSSFFRVAIKDSSSNNKLIAALHKVLYNV